MKYLLLSAIFLTAACGKYEVSGVSGSIGSVLPLSTGTVGNTSSLSTICQALGKKSGVQLANSTHIFSTIQTDCNGSNMTGGQLINTVIQGSGGNYYFKRQDNGMDFLFPEVDTQTFGVMAPICSALLNGQTVPSMSQLSNGDVQTVATSGFSSSDCAPGNGEICVYFQTASPNGSGSYVVHTKEWVRFKTNPQEAKVGFYSYRKKLTKSYCSQNQFVTYQAILK